MESIEAVQLRARVVADPDDLDLRLAYADAIEPRDPARASFIRLQCRANRDPGVESAADEAGLLATHGTAWAAHLAQRARTWRFIRGFIELVSVDAATFLRDGEEIAAADPVRHWDLSGAGQRLDVIAAHPALRRARSLSLAGNDLGDEDIRALAGAPALSQLVWLDIRRNPRIGPASLAILAGAPALQTLEVVDLEGIGSQSPLHRPAYDWDGTLVTVDRNPIGTTLENGVGRSIRWLYPLSDRVAEPDDRFRLRPHAR
jgi:uncharacterized protein (TIGR02996 family)